MPYKDPELNRICKRDWTRRQRADWLIDKQCASCGSTERMEVDHVNPSTKVSHRIWSWAKARRERELAKCQVLCRRCHRAKSNRQISALPPESVLIIRYGDGNQYDVAERFGVAQSTVSRIRSGLRRTATE